VILDPTTVSGRHARDRLQSAVVAWLTTVTADGQPQTLPIWFVWQDEEIVMYSDHRAKRNRNVEANPKVSFHLSDEREGRDIVTIEGDARIDPDYPPPGEHRAYLAKYGGRIDASFGGPAQFGQTYSVPIRIRPTRAVVFSGEG
jgi:PPOX class probable F420-dependent enzyme